MLGYPWGLDGGLRDYERDALIAYPGLEPSFLDLPWVQDGVTFTERKAMDNLQSLQREHPAIARVVLGYYWLDDGIDDDEVLLISTILNVARIDQSVAKAFIDLNWIADGFNRSFSNSEYWAIYYLENLVKRDPAMAKRLLEMPWMIDGFLNEAAPERETSITLVDGTIVPPTNYGSWATNGMWIRSFSGGIGVARPVEHATDVYLEPSLANRILDLPWFADGLTSLEGGALISIEYLAFYSSIGGLPSLVHRVMPWLEDGVTPSETLAMLNMGNTAWRDIELANAVANSSFFDDGNRVFHWAVPISLLDESSELGQQSWVRDGLTEEEAAKIVVFRGLSLMTDLDEENAKLYQPLIHGGHVVSEEFSSASAGDVKLFVVSRSPLQDESAVFRQLRLGIETIADFIGLPWPIADIIVHIEPEFSNVTLESGDLNGRYFTSHIGVFLPEQDPDFIDVLYHELAHYYFNHETIGYDWLSEGAPEFLASYVTRNDQPNTEVVGEFCADNGFTDIHQLTPTGTQLSSAPELTFCTYLLGHNFLWEMYNSLGPETVSSALREMHKTATGRAGSVKSQLRAWAVQSEEIYEAFLSSTPPEKQDEFRDLYSRLHGRPYEYPTGRDKDRAALVALYNATDGDNWLNNENWLTDAPIYQWHGVITDSYFRRVIRLDLPGNRLTGSIPAELASLVMLSHLNLDSNQLSGPIPPELGGLRLLKTLQLANNQLTGPIPPELGNLAYLHHLSLNANRLTGHIPPELGSISYLRGLYLQSNQLTGAVPAELGDGLYRLDDMNVSHNLLTGCIPGMIYRNTGASELLHEYALYRIDRLGGLPRC